MTPTVLVIDDDTAQLEELCDLVTGLGYRCIAADSGEAGQRMLRERDDIAIVLLDLYMPDLHGLAILAARESEPAAPPVQFIIISGWPKLDDAIEGFDLGAMTLLTKPVDPRELERQLAAAARRRAEDGKGGRRTGHFRERAQKILELSRRPQEPGDAPASLRHVRAHDRELYSLVALADDISVIGDSVARGTLSIKALRLLSEVIRAHVRADRLPVVTLCMAANMPQTTALRHLSELVSAGLVEKQEDPHDRRRLLVGLSDFARRELLRVSARRSSAFAPVQTAPGSTRSAKGPEAL